MAHFTACDQVASPGWQVLKGDHEYTVLSLASMLQLYPTYMGNTFKKSRAKPYRI